MLQIETAILNVKRAGNCPKLSPYDLDILADDDRFRTKCFFIKFFFKSKFYYWVNYTILKDWKSSMIRVSTFEVSKRKFLESIISDQVTEHMQILMADSSKST